MDNTDATNSVDRRTFIGASASALIGMSGTALAQGAGAPVGGAGSGAAARDAKKLSQQLAEFATGFDLKKAPPEVVERAHIAFIDTMGVMLAGSREEMAHLVLDMVKLEASAPTATIVGASLRASPQLAAMANGVSAHAMDYDFSFVSGQAVVPVIPAILALAETTGAPPAECLAAFIVGCEVGSRIARANIKASNVGGWHSAGVVGVIAAAVASARLLKLPAAALPDVIGMGTSLAGGISGNYGTMTKPLHAGRAARDGVMAALLARRGFTASLASLEGTAGYFETFGRGLDVSLEPFKDLGRSYDLMTAMSIKAYPCGGRGHTAIEAALELRDKVGSRLADIGNIHCFMTRANLARVGTSYPDTVEAAKFSASYVVAYSLVHGAPRIPAFTDEALKDERVKALAKMVTASADPSFGEGLESPAKVRVTFKDGQTIEARRDYATGTNHAPMSRGQLEAKFFDSAAQAVSPETARKILGVLSTLAERPSLDEFWPLVRVS